MQGLLGRHNLLGFWNSLNGITQSSIIAEFVSHKGFWDYNTLFEGNAEGSITHGDISVLNTLFVLSDIDVCDAFFQKFLEYSAENYLQYSNWGKDWQIQIENAIRVTQLANSGEFENDSANDRILYFQSLTPTDIYYTDMHFFLNNYSKKVYKQYLNGVIGVDRFLNAVAIELGNIEKINKSLSKILFVDVSNGLIEQYLIYLEKQKEYMKCIEVITFLCEKNIHYNLSQRYNRCLKKLEKHGNKS